MDREREGQAKAREWPIKDRIRNLGAREVKGDQPKERLSTAILRGLVPRGGNGPREVK